MIGPFPLRFGDDAFALRGDERMNQRLEASQRGGIIGDGAGEPLTWSFEGNPAGMLTAQGYRRNTFAPAAQVTVLYNPMKDGKPGGGRLVGAILSDGSTVGQVPAP